MSLFVRSAEELEWRGASHSAQVSTEREEKFGLSIDGFEGSLKVGRKAETGFVSQKKSIWLK